MSKIPDSKSYLIMGAYGLLGIRLSNFLENKGYIVYRHGRSKFATYKVDSSVKEEVELLINRLNPNVIINLVAMTNVDRCQKEPVKAYINNAQTVQSISESIIGSDIKFIHISTDQVYDGIGPHKENSCNPCNVYASSKRQGEIEALKSEAIVLRTNFVGKSLNDSRKSFTDWLINSLRNKLKIKLFNNFFFNPLHIHNLSEAIEIVSNNKINKGIYNLGSKEAISKAEFAIKLAEQLDLDTSFAEIFPMSNKDLYAPRPHDMTMNLDKFEDTYNYRLPSLSYTILNTKKDYILK